MLSAGGLDGLALNFDLLAQVAAAVDQSPASQLPLPWSQQWCSQCAKAVALSLARGCQPASTQPTRVVEASKGSAHVSAGANSSTSTWARRLLAGTPSEEVLMAEQACMADVLSFLLEVLPEMAEVIASPPVRVTTCLHASRLCSELPKDALCVSMHLWKKN